MTTPYDFQTSLMNFQKKPSLGGINGVETAITDNVISPDNLLMNDLSPIGGMFNFGMEGAGTDVGGIGGIFKDLGGLGGMGQLASGVGSIFSAMNAGDQLDEAKRQAGVAEQYASLNAFNSGQQVNTGLRDRQRSRVMSQGLPQGDSGKYQSVKSYMDQNKVRTGV